ncbi:phosphatidylinositol-specific phospholipase C/glycerophosphodiester phosphodiesterase family protein [Sunxiuqinia elliptica]
MKFWLTVAWLLASCMAGAQPIAHAHNDYEHKRPLLDALSFDFRSIEADIYAIGDSLFVAHDFDEIKPGRTLRTLYLDPLQNLIQENGGAVYGDGHSIYLLVDIKDDAVKTYQLLHKILEDYEDCLTVVKNGKQTQRAVQVVVSGNRPMNLMGNQKVRYAGYDGRLKDLKTGVEAQLMPWVSDSWTDHFSWNGKGEFPLKEKEHLRQLVEQVRSKGYLLRFWGTPNKTESQRMAIWKELKDAGVAIIGADDLKGLQEFLQTSK